LLEKHELKQSEIKEIQAYIQEDTDTTSLSIDTVFKLLLKEDQNGQFMKNHMKELELRDFTENLEALLPFLA
jgi:hypothetical protein